MILDSLDTTSISLDTDLCNISIIKAAYTALVIQLFSARQIIAEDFR